KTADNPLTEGLRNLTFESPERNSGWNRPTSRAARRRKRRNRDLPTFEVHDDDPICPRSPFVLSPRRGLKSRARMGWTLHSSLSILAGAPVFAETGGWWLDGGTWPCQAVASRSSP